LKPSPGEIPRLRGVEIAGLSMPLAQVIGGDHIIYVDFDRRYDLERRLAEAEKEGREEVVRKLKRQRHRAGILVADVSGHRMTDALVGAMLHQAFLLGVNYELDMFGEVTTRLFEHLNTRFYRTTATNKYFTMIYGEISDRGNFRFLSAAHQPPAVFSREFWACCPRARSGASASNPGSIATRSGTRSTRSTCSTSATSCCCTATG
jgi:serine phosphatase RsbU (regulator of sigma subunit)